MSEEKYSSSEMPPSEPVEQPPSYVISQQQESPIPMTAWAPPILPQFIHQQQPARFGGAPVPPSHSITSFEDYLQTATTFHIEQKIQLEEVLCPWQALNEYSIRDETGKEVFLVVEDSEFFQRQCCCSVRQFNLRVKDPLGQTVLSFERPLACPFFCGLFCKDIIEVKDANGQKLGYVEQTFNLLFPKYNLMDASGKTRLILEGPLLPCSFYCQTVVFELTSPDGAAVGSINKEFSGFVRECFSDTDDFNMSFPIDLDPSMKAICLAALFLVEYEHFERGVPCQWCQVFRALSRVVLRAH